MKFCSTFALCAVAAAALTVSDAANCDFGAIQSKLFPNATAGLQQCAKETGVDIWKPNAFPTTEQAQKVMTTRTCVDFLNQINERANREIQCDVMIGDTTKGFGAFITDILTGQTGNQTEVDTAGSTDDTVEVPDNAKAKPSPLLDDSSTAGAVASKKAATPVKSAVPTPVPTESAAATTAQLSTVAAGALAVVSVALQW